MSACAKSKQQHERLREEQTAAMSACAKSKHHRNEQTAVS
jgi:hypothetical protein